MPEIFIIFWIPALAIFIAFAWAVKFHFASEHTPIEMKVISALALCLLAAAIAKSYAGEPGMIRTVAALVAVVASAVLFFSAMAATRGQGLSLAFDERSPSQIVTRGPYSLIRHPFYGSYIIFWVALVLFSGSVLAAAIAVVLIFLYVRAARREEMFLRRELGDAYSHYVDRTGFLVPKLGR